MHSDRGLDADILPKPDTLPPDPSLFFARVRIQRDPIVAFKAYYLTKLDLKKENYTNFENHPPISLSIVNFNLEAEAADFVDQQSLEGTFAEKVVQMMPKKQRIAFQILADVQAEDMPLPRSRWVSTPGFPNPVKRPHVIEVVFDKTKGFIANCESLTPEQVNFCLQMLIKSLDFTLSKARKGRIQPGNKFEGREEDSIVFDDYFLTATDADLRRDLLSQSDREKYAKIGDQKFFQLEYLKATLEEILDKRTNPRPKTLEDAM